ncbi:MAG: DUF3341 domain-containing protein [Proteobacteria bacterium]|nr:DUF3341 domain-containing protein [Pseudomonadota bacterium]
MAEHAADPTWGVLAEFASPTALYRACEQLRDAGFTRWDAHSPFPVHGLDRAMGLRPSRLPWVVFGGGMLGAAGGLGLQWWTSTIAYPQVIAGKPHFSWPAFVPVTFELGVLAAALACVLGMLHFNRLPRLHHPIFRSTRFEGVSDDRFFISIEAADPRFDPSATPGWLTQLGATQVELLAE